MMMASRSSSTSKCLPMNSHKAQHDHNRRDGGVSSSASLAMQQRTLESSSHNNDDTPSAVARIQYAATLSERATDMLLSADHPSSSSSFGDTATTGTFGGCRKDETAIESYKEALCILKDLMLELDVADIDGANLGASANSVDDDDDEDIPDDDTISVQRIVTGIYGDELDDEQMVADDSMDYSDTNQATMDTNSVPRRRSIDGTTFDHSKEKSNERTSPDGACHSRKTVPVLMTAHPFRLQSTSAKALLETDQIYIYKNLIRYIPSGNVKVDTNLLSATIIFNMALLYHHHGSIGGSTHSSTSSSSSSRTIHESDLSSLYGLCLQLYDMAVILVERILSSPSFSSSPTSTRQQKDDNDNDFDRNFCGCEWECLFLRMVCLNNMAQAAYENRDYVQSRDLLDVLQVSMREDEAVSKIFLDEVSVHGIILNCILLHPPSAAEAA